MPMPEKGKWEPYNVRAILNNVKLVFKNRDIEKLNGPTYKFITLHMGFIAHFSLHGFRGTYQDLETFAKHLQTSEYSRDDHDYNLKQAKRQESDSDFDRWYGPAYNKSVAETIRGIVEVARKYYPGTRGSIPMFDPSMSYLVHAAPITAPRPKKRRARRVSPKTTLKGVR